MRGGCFKGGILEDEYEIRRVMRQVCQEYPTGTRNGNRNRLEHVSSVKGSKLHTSPPKPNLLRFVVRSSGCCCCWASKNMSGLF